MDFPKPNILRVDDKGRLKFTIEQWKFLLKFCKSKAKTISGQRKAIKKLVQDALLKLPLTGV